jgi:alanine-alpha-ketoisovalerate/valine-pyruvate aminotransferase
VSETAAQIVLSNPWNGDNQLLSPEDIIRLDALARLETILIIDIKAELGCWELYSV